MGGFEISQAANLEFEEGSRLHGAKVRVSLDMQIRDYVAMLRLAREWESRVSEEMGPDDVELVSELLEQFGEQVLLGWDLVKNGEALPANGAGMAQLPMQVALILFRAWQGAVSAVPPNSDGASASGGPSEAPRETMAASSPSPLS